MLASHVYSNMTVVILRLPSGERLHFAMENHHAINGILSTISMAIFHCKMLVHIEVTTLSRTLQNVSKSNGFGIKTWDIAHLPSSDD